VVQFMITARDKKVVRCPGVQMLCFRAPLRREEINFSSGCFRSFF
jgi:hypothetical protein